MEQFHGTTIVSVRRGSTVALGGDGQVTLGNIVIKGTARKVRKLYNGRVLAGFAGGTADAFTLIERFEAKLEKHQGNLLRSSVELAKDWRTDRMLRRLEAMLLVADRESTLVITGNGDVLEPEEGEPSVQVEPMPNPLRWRSFAIPIWHRLLLSAKLLRSQVTCASIPTSHILSKHWINPAFQKFFFLQKTNHEFNPKPDCH